MKKQFLLIVPLFFVYTVALAQIPNASFENWTGGNPDNWFTGNVGPLVFVTQSSNAHDGTKAAKCSVVNVLGNAESFPFALGSSGTGVMTSTAPEAVHGWYIGSFNSNDSADVIIGMLQNGSPTGAGIATLSNTSVYKEFVANVIYSSGIPNGDSLLIFFIMFGDTLGGTPHVGSNIIVDDLSFGLPTGTSDVKNVSLSGLETISPNPCSDEAQIIYNIRESGNTALNIYDLNGKMVKSVVNEEQTPGRYKAFTNLSDLPEGTYICRLMSGSVNDFRKVLVQR